MDETRRQLRRGSLALAYGLLTGVLVHLVGEDLPWIGHRLAEIAAIVPEPLRPVSPSAGVAVVALSLFAVLVCAGTLVLSRRTGTGFGLLAVATVAIAVFPYARVPWARLVGAPAGETYAAPASVWILSGSLVLLATLEIGVCARERVLEELEHRGLPTGLEGPAARLTAQANRRWLAASSLLGAAIVLAFALLHPLSQRLAGNLDLLWVPALAGLVAGGALWLWAER